MTIRRTSNTLFTSILLGLSLTYGSAYADQSKPTISDPASVASTYRDDRSVCDAPLSGEPFARLGAPWVTGIDDVYALGDELGLDVIQNVLSADLHRWYWPTRPMNASFLGFYSLCTLATKADVARLIPSRGPRAII